MLSDGRVLYVPGVGQWDGKAWTYELPDGLGSTRQLADAQGYLVQRYEYGPFGEMLASEGQRTNSLRYTGEQWDSDVGLLYLRARWYDPSVGRFTTRDPFYGFVGLPQTQNPYVYVNNNPINLTDPGGDNPIIIVLVSAGAIVVIGGGVILYTYYFSPYAAQNRTNFASGMCELGRGVQNRYNEAMAFPTAVITLGSEAIRSGINVLQAQDGRPGNNQAQNKQFRGAMKEVARQLGRKLTQDEERQVHEALHNSENAGFWGIVEEAMNLFGHTAEGQHEEDK